MGKKLDENVINQIPVLYKKLGIKKKVAEELGISVSTVTKYLTIFEAAPTPSTRTKVTPELIEKINEEYSKYRSLKKVAEELGISSATVKKHLSEENLNLKNAEKDDLDALFYYIIRLFGIVSEEEPVSKWNIVQMQKFKNQGMPYRGQLLTLKYFYEVKHNSTKKSNGSIGIISHVFSEAEAYYRTEAKRAEEISESIKRQLEQDRKEIKYNPSDYIGKKKKKKLIDLNSINGQD